MRVMVNARRWVAFGAVTACLLAGLDGAPALSQDKRYETPSNFAARQILPPALRQSPYHTILDPVQNDGFLNIYRMKTKFGEFLVVGTELLKVRIKEAEAAAKLADVSASGQMLKSAGRTVTKPLKTGKDLITRPGKTVKRTFRGIGRFFGRVGAGLDATDRVGHAVHVGLRGGQQVRHGPLALADPQVEDQAIAVQARPPCVARTHAAPAEESSGIEIAAVGEVPEHHFKNTQFRALSNRIIRVLILLCHLGES